MATASQRKAYARRLAVITRNLGTLERNTLQQSIRLLRTVRNELAGQLINTDFSRFRIAEQQGAIDDILAGYENKVRALGNGAVRQSFVLGERSVIEPLQELGLEGVFFRPSTEQIEILAQFSADMIGDLSKDALRKINRSIRINALGGSSSIDAMRDITNILFKTSRPPSPFTAQPTKGVAYEAERILRTEVNRTYNMAAHAQQLELAKDVPDLRKQWIATMDGRTRASHASIHGEVRLTKRQFSNGLMIPGDPSGPAEETINCRCRSVAIIPEVAAEVEKEAA